MNKSPRAQPNKRAMSAKAHPKKQLPKQRKSKKVHHQSKRTVMVSQYSNGRVVPGVAPTFYSAPNKADYIQSLQHAKDMAELQTQETVNEVAGILASNQYIPKMVLSGDLKQAQANTRAFYRKVLRLIPGLLESFNMYELNAKSIIPVIRSQFEQHGVITSPQVMDSLRWEAEVQFADIVRLYYTESHVFGTLFPDLHFAMLPKLPAAALPESYDPVMTKIEYESSPFLQNFLDPSIEQRKLREASQSPGYTHV
jgi:hypothetical protein